jgi:hypothetical protein
MVDDALIHADVVASADTGQVGVAVHACERQRVHTIAYVPVYALPALRRES